MNGIYRRLWGILPGPVWVRVLCIIATLLIIFFVCAEWVFPFATGMYSTDSARVVVQ